MRRISSLIGILFIVGVVCASLSSAADGPMAPAKNGYPNKPFTFLVPSTPGGGWDLTARSMQQALTTEKILPVAVEVVNKPGAGGIIALTEHVQKKDPYQIMITGSAMVTSIMINKSPYNFKNVSPLARMISDLEVIAVAKDSKYKDIKELIADFKKDPKSVTWAGGAPGSVDHALAGMMGLALGVDIKDVNYIAFAGSDNLPVIISGKVSAGICGYAEFKPHVESGRIRFLAVSTEKRLPSDPDVPTLKESGLDLVVGNWRGVAGAPGLDADSYAWLVEAMTRMRGTKTWKELLVKNGWNDVFLAGEPFKKFIDQETEMFHKVLKATGQVQ